MNNIYDSIIIGASAAGISAAIYLERQNRNFLIIAKDIGGEMALSGIVENYPGFPETNGVELTQRFKEHMEKYGIAPINEKVIALEKENNIFKVKTNKNEYLTKTIIIATGSSPKKLNIPGEEKFYHKGLSYCYVCDLPLFRNKVVAIIGGGNSANEGGIMGSRICQKVYIINKNPEMKGDKVLIEELKRQSNVEIIYNALTQEIYGDEFVKGLKYLDKISGKIKDLKVDGVFIHIGLKANTDFVPDNWGIKNEYGEIVINQLCQTNMPGVFAAGDVTNIPHKQIGIAVGQGIIAALEVNKFLNSNK
ncbi:MAG: thioredoxin-disulfide reductase [Candidatus Parcubacteria bacterium]|nr:MAG: thioredoxin-disulfide reductase [Candidatus Parcubacteria bacterium]